MPQVEPWIGLVVFYGALWGLYKAIKMFWFEEGNDE